MSSSTTAIRAILDEARQLAASHDNLFEATFDVYDAEFKADHTQTPEEVALKWSRLADSHARMREKVLGFSTSLADTLLALARNGPSITAVDLASDHIM